MKKLGRLESILVALVAAALLLGAAVRIDAQHRAAVEAEKQRAAWEYASRVFLQTKAERDRFYQQLQRPCSVIWGA